MIEIRKVQGVSVVSSCYLFAMILAVFSGSLCLANPPTFAVSLFELLFFPSPYIGKEVSVKGYLTSEANVQLFFSKDHAMIRDFQTAIPIADTGSLEISQSKCIDKYVEIIGTFSRLETREYVIQNVTRILEPISRKDCWTPTPD